MKKRKFRRYDHSDGFFQGSKGPKGPVRKFLELWLENVWTLIPVNMVWVMLRVLLIPGGLAQAGMTYLCLEMSRSRHTFGIAGFFETIKKFWRKALPMGLGCCLASMFFLSLVEPYVWLLNRPAGKISAGLFFISSILPAVEMVPMAPRLL